MSPWIPWLVAAASTAACVTLWFRETRRSLRRLKSTLDSAASQVAACRKRASETCGDAASAAVLERSESIYRQAVEHYNDTLSRPWVYLPGRLMGFRLLNQAEQKRREEL